MKLLKISGLCALVFILGCASVKYPYFDSALNDHNRAPASLGIPVQVNSDIFSLDNHNKNETEKPQSQDPVSQSISSEQAKADYYFLKAEFEAQEGLNANSIESLKYALTFDAQSASLMQKLALQYYRKGQISDSIYWIQKALEKEPKDHDNLMLYGSLLMSKKDYDLAEQVYLKIIKLYPDKSASYLCLGGLYSEKNDFKKAHKYLTQVIKMDDYEVKYLPYYYRARTILDLKQKSYYPQARKDLDKVLSFKPDHLEALQTYSQIIEATQGKKAVFEFYIHHQKTKGPVEKLAEVLAAYFIEKEQYDKAYEQLEVLENVGDQQIQAKLKMSLILIEKKNFKAAQGKLEELLQLVPDSDKVKYYLGAVYEELKQPEKAIPHYLAIAPTSTLYDESLVRASLLYKVLSDNKKVVSVLTEGLKVKKDNLQVYLMLSQAFEDEKEYNKALEVLKQAEIQFPKNSQVQYFIGAIYDRMGQKESMLKHMRSSIELDEKNFQALNYIAYSLSEQGQSLDEAEKYALKAFELQKEDSYIVDTLGWVYFKKGEYQKAVKYIEKAHELSPEVGVIAEHLGDVYIKLKKEDKARAAYMKAKSEEKDLERLKVIDNKLTNLKEWNPVPARIPASVDIVFP